MLEGRYTDEQFNAGFKKTKEKGEKEKKLMVLLAEAGENVLLHGLLEKRKEKRKIVEKVNKDFSLSWRKRTTEKFKAKVK